MARFERSRERKGRSSGRSGPKRESSGSGTFEDFMKGKGRRSPGRDSGRGRRDSGRGRRDSGRGSRRFGNKRRDLEMTKVICSECGIECEVPFKPTSSKPVYCSDCFEKKEKGGSSGNSSKDLNIINEKLDKIMKALKID